MSKQKSLYEDLQAQREVLLERGGEGRLVLENPAKYLAESYEALTDDLDQNAVKHQPFSRDWNIAKLLENQAKHLLETTTTALPSGQDFTFTTIAMPLVRKIFSRLIAMDLVSVQPISQPTSKIFYLDFLYEDAPAGGSAGDSVYSGKGGTDHAYATSGETGAVKEINLKITNETITAIQKKLKAIWTVEVEQDLQSYHNLSAETELMAILQEQITREVDGLIINALLAGAGGTGTGTGTGAGNVNWNTSSALVGDTTSTYLKDYRRTLYEAVLDASNLIYKKRYRHANWIIGHPDAVLRLEKLEDFKISPTGPDTATVGRYLAGTIGDRFKVYKDPFFPVTTKLLLGYKGDSWTDAVGYYAPYIPLYMTPKIIDTNDFKPRRGLMSRFAYGTLIKDGLATITITST